MTKRIKNSAIVSLIISPVVTHGGARAKEKDSRAAFIAASLIFTVKASERITLVKYSGDYVDGAKGVVVREIRVLIPSEVRVNSLMWSAYADSTVPVGQQVRVIRREGLHLWVEPIKETPDA